MARFYFVLLISMFFNHHEISGQLSNFTFDEFVTLNNQLSKQCLQNSPRLIQNTSKICEAEFNPHWLCWPDTPPNVTITTACPSMLYNNTFGQIKRKCLSNGTWDTSVDKSECVPLNTQQSWWNVEDFLRQYNFTRPVPSNILPTQVPPKKSNERLEITIDMLQQFSNRMEDKCHKDAFTLDSVSSSKKCPVDFVLFQCWSETILDTTLRMPCVNSILYNEGLMERKCLTNGIWSLPNTSNCTRSSVVGFREKLYRGMENIGIKIYAELTTKVVNMTTLKDFTIQYRNECLNKATKIKNLNSTQKCGADMELRYLQCWSETPSDSTASIPCQRPFFVPFQGSITRQCLSNGTWERHSNATQCIRLHPGQLWWRLEDLLNKYGVYRVMPAYVNTTTKPEPPKPVPFNKTSFQKTVTVHGHNTTQKLPGVKVVCPATVDHYYQYWPDGVMNSTLVQPCNRNFFEHGLTERSCGSNGKWVSRVDTSNCVKRSNETAIGLDFQMFVGRLGYETDLNTTEYFLAKTGLFNASSSVRPSSTAISTKSIPRKIFTTSIDATKTPNKTSAFSNTTTSPSATRLSRITPSEEEHLKNIFTIKCKEISNRTDASPTNMTCSGHVDEYYHCWQETPANSTIRIPCISLYFYSDRHIDRHCNKYGEWEDINIDDICLPLEEYQVLKRWKSLLERYNMTMISNNASRLYTSKLVFLWLLVLAMSAILFNTV